MKYNFKKYHFEPIKPEEEYIEVIVMADSNDGDYITEIERFTIEYFNEYIIDGLIDLKKYYGDRELKNYPDKFDLYFIPVNEMGEFCHTLESVSVRLYQTDGTVWEVQY